MQDGQPTATRTPKQELRKRYQEPNQQRNFDRDKQESESADNTDHN
jgi:hypothetical protein